MIEAWHSTLEFELRSLEHFTTKGRARARVAAWIGGLDRGLQHRPLALRAGHAQRGRLRARPSGRGGGLRCPLPAAPGSAGARACQGRSSSGLTALRGLHLDSSCAPAVTWQLTGSGQSKVSSIQSAHASRGSPPARADPLTLTCLSGCTRSALLSFDPAHADFLAALSCSAAHRRARHRRLAAFRLLAVRRCSWRG